MIPREDMKEPDNGVIYSVDTDVGEMWFSSYTIAYENATGMAWMEERTEYEEQLEDEITAIWCGEYGRVCLAGHNWCSGPDTPEEELQEEAFGGLCGSCFIKRVKERNS